MLTEIVNGIKLPDFERIEVEDGYNGLIEAEQFYTTFINLLTTKGVYRGPPQFPFFKQMLIEYLATTAKKAA